MNVNPSNYFIFNSSRPVNRISLQDFALPVADVGGERPPVIAVFGTAMSAGKTLAMASIARGETLAGRRVGAAKVTGTGSGGDLWSYVDAGAADVVDFTDAGFATTYRIGLNALEQIAATLTGQSPVSASLPS